MGDLVVFFAKLVGFRDRSLRFLIFAGQHGDMGFDGIVFGLEMLVLAAQGAERVDDFLYFRFKLFGFSHKPIILLEVILGNSRAFSP